MRIHIDTISVETIIGIHDWEKANKQPLHMSVWFDYDATKAVQQDDITHAVDYDDLTNAIISHCEEHHYGLIETLADTLCSLMLEYHPGIVTTNIIIQKPLALKGRADYVAVEHRKNRT